MSTSFETYDLRNFRFDLPYNHFQGEQVFWFNAKGSDSVMQYNF